MNSPPTLRCPTRLLLLLALLLGAAVPAAAQEMATRPQITLEDIHASDRFAPETFRGGRWADEGPVVTYVDEDDDATHLMRYNLETDERTRLIDGRDLTAGDVGRLIQIEDYQYSQDESQVLLYTDSERVWRYNTKGYYYVYDLGSGELTPLAPRDAGFQMFAKFSPTGDQVAFVRDRNLFLVDLPSMKVTPLTDDGADGGIINGTFDWVYEEEFDLRDGFSWGPEGRYISFFKLDESQTKDFSMTDFQTLYPEEETFRYPKAGTSNSEIQIGVIDTQHLEAAPLFFDTETWNAGGERYEYLARMGWTPSTEGAAKVWMYRLNRDQNRLDLLYGDPATGALTTTLQEEVDTYIDIDDEKLTFLEDDAHFVWASEESGYNQLYLYTNTGERVAPITQGDFEVTAFHGIDEEKGVAYVTTTAAGSTQRQLYRVPFQMEPGAAPGSPERITEQAGWHSIDMAPSLSYYIDTYSNASTPPTVTLRRASGEQLAVLEDNAALKERLAKYDLPEQQFTTVPGADGTPLNAYLVKPRDFDPDEEYPLLLYVYGGPGAQTVTDQWGGARELWHRYLAATHDLVIASVDNRGTGGRGKAFQSAPYKQLGLLEARDQIAAAQHLADSSFVDEDRVGIWGWSYGGYMTLLSMLFEDGPQTFRTGLAVAPVTNWKNYDTIYTERYMSTPQNNETGYEEGSPVNYADRLQDDQHLLVVHGLADDNVHVQNTLQMVEALEAAEKQFDLMLYPGRDHGIYGGTTRLHLFTLLTDYVEENLIELEDETMAVR